MSDKPFVVDVTKLGPIRISVDCFRVWSRSDPEGLEREKKRRGGLIVRVPVPRQVWPHRTMDD